MIVVALVVTDYLSIGIYSSDKWVIFFSNPNIACFKEISTIWIRFYPYLDHFYVGISTIVTSKSEGAPMID